MQRLAHSGHILRAASGCTDPGSFAWFGDLTNSPWGTRATQPSRQAIGRQRRANSGENDPNCQQGRADQGVARSEFITDSRERDNNAPDRVLTANSGIASHSACRWGWWLALKMPWRRKTCGESPEVRAAKAATRRSFEDLAWTKARTAGIEELSDHLVELGRRNHFGESIEHAMTLRERKKK